jgi:hypothetical protein
MRKTVHQQKQSQKNVVKKYLLAIQALLFKGTMKKLKDCFNILCFQSEMKQFLMFRDEKSLTNLL